MIMAVKGIMLIHTVVLDGMMSSVLNKEYHRVRQITRLKQYGCAITNEVASLVLRIFLDQEIFFGSLLANN